MRAFAVAALTMGGLVAGACGGSSPPTQPSPPVVRAIAVTGTAPPIGSTAQFSATAVFFDGAARNITAEAIWSSSAPSVAQVAAGGLVTGVSAGSAVISATYQSVAGGVGIAIAPATGSLTPFMRDYIEALFLGTGALTPTDGVRGCPTGFGRWLGYPKGTSVDLLVSSAVLVFDANAVIAAATAVPTASAGWLSVTTSATADPNPLPVANQVTTTRHPDPISLGCGFPQGCTQFTFGPASAQIRSARAILVTNQFRGAYVHDAIGHGVMGLCHVDGNLIGGANLSLMSFGPGVFSNALPLQLSPFDLVATQAVFSSGLAPGATRAEFLQAGLVNAATAGAHPAAIPAITGRPSQVAAPRVR